MSGNQLLKILFFSIFLIILGMSCKSKEEYISPVRKNVDPNFLVSELLKDSLFYKFKGYSITPRNERLGIYLINRAKDPETEWHWVKYHPNKSKFITYYNSYLNEDSVVVKLTSSDSLEILNKAHELIGILKDLHMRWAGWDENSFECYFNDSTRMTYVKNKSELDSNFYRFYRNLNWIDSNFVTYY